MVPSSSMSAPARKATYADLEALPENVVGELLDGELFTMPRPSLRHACVASALGMDLGAPFQRGRGGPGGWWIVDEPELHLGDDVLVPDLAGWRRERVPAIPDARSFPVAPDWVCEIASPSTARFDRVRKMPRYASAAVPYLWLVDPVARTLEAYRLEHGRWLLLGAHGEEPSARIEPFDAIELAVPTLFEAFDVG